MAQETSGRGGAGRVAGAPARAGGSVAPEPGRQGNKLLRLTMVAERLGCSKKAAWRLYRDGAFPGAVLILGAVRVPEAEVLAVAAKGWPSRRGTPRDEN